MSKMKYMLAMSCYMSYRMVLQLAELKSTRSMENNSHLDTTSNLHHGQNCLHQVIACTSIPNN